MKSGKIHLVLIIFFSILLILILYSEINNSKENLTEKNGIKVIDTKTQSMLFLKDNLETNTSKASIDLYYILDGGPGKDGIPAINNPKFVDINDTKGQIGLNNETLGISVNIGKESKFYPYSILYWHEIVNDEFVDRNIVITFCPLCGTAIVYNGKIDGEVHLFGVSGKLYESNLLMYDNKTETLWSQSLGEALIGDYLGKHLDIIESNVMSFKEFKENYPSGKVLSEKTGFVRDYGITPYGSYESDNDLYFPVQNSDKRLHKKELLYVVPYNGESYAFIRSKLIKEKNIEYKIGEEVLEIKYENGKIISKIGNKIIPGYIEMFFSWATGHPGNENLWGIDK